MKKCPFCAEEIQDDAIKCRFCNEILLGNPLLSPQRGVVKSVPWYFQGWFIITIFLTLPPFSLVLALPLVWISSHRSQRTKIIWTIILIILSYLSWLMIKATFEFIKVNYGPILQTVAPDLKV